MSFVEGPCASYGGDSCLRHRNFIWSFAAPGGITESYGKLKTPILWLSWAEGNGVRRTTDPLFKVQSPDSAKYFEEKVIPAEITVQPKLRHACCPAV